MRSPGLVVGQPLEHAIAALAHFRRRHGRQADLGTDGQRSGPGAFEIAAVKRRNIGLFQPAAGATGLPATGGIEADIDLPLNTARSAFHSVSPWRTRQMRVTGFLGISTIFRLYLRCKLGHWNFIHPGLLEAGNSINRGELFVTLLLKLSQLIDWINERVGKGAFWLVLIMTVISAGNASWSLLYSMTVQRPAGNPVVSVCRHLPALLAARCKKRTRPHRRAVRQTVAARPGGHRHHRHPVFLLPMVVLVLWLSVPLVAESYRSTKCRPTPAA